MRPSHRDICLLDLATALVAVYPFVAESAPRASDSQAIPGDAFATALALDRGGNLWAVTEDLGLFRLDATGSPTRPNDHFTAISGLNDNTAYALAFDTLGRLWVGTLNHGVSVWNGESWRHYDVLDGPIGERVFDIACNPVDGDVWIATSAGLTRYEQGCDRWRHYTRTDGLPSDQANALAFDRKGNLYVGTQCHGIAYARATSVNNVLEYYKWNVAAAPERFGPGGVSPVPLEPAGAGLPSSLINDLLVGRDGTIWAATTAGLAWSRNGGTTWQFLRGQDWEAKVQGLLGGAPAGWRPRGVVSFPSGKQPDSRGGVPPPLGQWLLPEDRVTCLAEDARGLIWTGHWRKGWSLVHPQTLQVAPGPSGEGRQDYALAIQPVPEGPPWIAWYGGGVSRAEVDRLPAWVGGVSAPAGREVPGRSSREAKGGRMAEDGDYALNGIPLKPPIGGTSRHPSPAAPPTESEVRAFLRQIEQAVEAGQRTPNPPKVVPLPDDWRTQGDWLGRYGRYWACLSAMVAPSDYTWGAGPRHVPYCAHLGNQHAVGDSLRYWVHWQQTTNRRSLLMSVML